MALRGTLTHWKTRLLARELGIPANYALGVLEALWHVTAELAPSGNIGRLPNAAIAMEMFHDGDPEQLISALVKSGHLDADDTHRLIVHDWHIFSDDATDNKLARGKQKYANGVLPRMKRLSKTERADLADEIEAHENAHKATTSHTVAQKATESHEKPLPVPVPEPVPDPEPEKVSVASQPHPDSGEPGTGEGSAKRQEAISEEHCLEIYRRFPRQEGRKAALKAIRNAVRRICRKQGTVLEAERFLALKVIEYARSPAGQNPDKTLIPHPATWFNQERYYDDTQMWQQVRGAGNGIGMAQPTNRAQQRTDGNLAALAQVRARRAAREAEDAAGASGGVVGHLGGDAPGGYQRTDAGALPRPAPGA